MKKFLAAMCAAALLMVGCGGEKVADKPSGDVVKLGVLTHLNSTEESFGETLSNIEEETGSKTPKHLPKFYDSLKLMQLGIESGDIEAISTYKSVADYLVANNNKFEIVKHDALNKLEDSFCFAVRKDETQLKDDLNKTIGEMKSDGTLDELINDYITNVDKGETPPKVEIPKFEGAETIKVGVTGDLPPLD
ncbi:MAG: transporter substrate-binding domain-containing protein [Selenomonadaceae bacterium]|nr:transporter substrate-binding domain-containing protein [Selenomonadaceae bacterium]